MKISNTALNLISKWEGFYDKAYRDPVGIWTIGYGTTKWSNGQVVQQGQTIKKDDALELLRKQAQEHANTIEQYVKVPLNQNQYDALASFQYNLGRNILRNSALLNYLNARQWDKACNEMLLYCHAGGKKLQGLVNRRKDEVALFKKPVVNVSVDVSNKIEYLEIDKEPKKFRILSGNYGSREAMIAAMNATVQQKYLSYAEPAQGNSNENGWRFISGWSNTLPEAKQIAERAIVEGKLSYATIRGTSK
ncbi:lysozyme [Lysinibacillus sphaericus]|uniref:Lysozyme n=1 Tax=Lysinibacillus sphaericus TaxID=1421 RepID=A0A544U7N9_LYSSH|nr:lysozyme [Lysinibacillus sp. SDF0037]TQR27204.1 lysozyme [Lysinibacillus sp. SDF0037]